MKNERIITHFQSYTTVHDCVKDLTPYFAGRISIMAHSPLQQSEETTKVRRQEETDFEIRGAEEEARLVEGMSEIGGIALGTAAYLVPGLGPVLSGGPIAGQAAGDTIGHYLSAQMAEERGRKNGREHEAPAEVLSCSDDRQGAFFLAVDTYTEEEADYVTRILEQYGGKVTRMTVEDQTDAEPEEAEVRYVPADAETRYVAGISDSQFPQFPCFPEIGSERILSAEDGYALDPVAPLSPQNWIDPNIGLGNYDLFDPATRTRDNSQPPDDLR
jgi:hypothetical protein